MKYGIMEGFRSFSSQFPLGLPPSDGRISLFSKAGELGFQGIEFGIGLDFQEDPLWTGTGDLRESMKREVEETGVEAASICLHLLNCEEYSPASERDKYRKVGVRIVRGAVEACAVIGASVILVPFFGTASLTSEGHIDRLIEAISSLSSFAEEREVYLALETSLEAPEVVRIVDTIDSGYVQVYFDIGNAVSLGYDLADEIDKLGRRIVQVHVKDNPSTKMMGEGRVDFKAAIEELIGVGFDGYLMLETPSTDEPEVAATANLAYLQQIIGDL